MSVTKYLLNSNPVAPMKIIALPGCTSFARTIDDYLFSKHSFYSNEEEIRFYFDKQNYNEHKQLEKAVYIKVDPTVLIDKIILSPLMDNKKVDEVITRIRNNFNFEIKKSSISLKNG